MPPARHRARATHSVLATISRFAPAAGVVIATLFTVGMSADSSDSATVDTSGGRAVTAADRHALEESRHVQNSRSGSRVALQVTMRRVPADHEFATANLNIWTQPREQG